MLVVSLVAILICVLSYNVLFANEATMTSGKAILKANNIDLDVIVLDAGHGGYDTGSTRFDYYEKDITLDYVLRVGKLLEDQGFEVLYTRENDDWYWTEDNIVDLDARVAIANENQADVFVSIHLNDSDYEATGIETWVSFNDADSYQLAFDIQTALLSIGYSSDRDLRDQGDNGLRVLSNNMASSCLVELGFMSDWEELHTLIDPVVSESIVEALANAISAQFK